MRPDLIELVVLLHDSHHGREDEVARCLAFAGCRTVEPQSGSIRIRVPDDLVRNLWKINGVSLICKHNGNQLDRS